VENHGLSRLSASLWAGGVTWLLGIGSLLSFNLWKNHTLFGKNFFELLDYLTANIMLPLGGVAIAIFAAWLMSRSATKEELEMENESAFNLWRFLVRYITPVAVVIVFLNAVGLL